MFGAAWLPVNRFGMLVTVPEGANIKLASVPSEVTGVGGRRVLHRLVQGQEDSAVLADLVSSRVKAAREEIERALAGLMSDHRRFRLKGQLDHQRYQNRHIEGLDKEIEGRLKPAKQVLERVATIPGVGKRTARVIVIQVGTDVRPFPRVARFFA